MVRHTYVAIAAMAALASGGSAHASALLGSTVTGSITGSTDYVVTAQFPASATVGPGTEFTGGISDTPFSNSFDITANFTEDALIIAFSSSKSFANVSGTSPFTLNFGSASGYFGGIGAITQISCVPVYGCGRSKISVTGDAKAINIDVSAIFAGDSFQIALSPPAVPEPATWALMIIGFGAIGAAMRKRQPARATLALDPS